MAESSPWISYGLLALGALVFLYRQLTTSRLPNFPAIGYTAPGLSYLSAFHYMSRGGEILQQGYKKYKGGAFKVSELFNWHVIVTSPPLIEELRQAKEEDLSMVVFLEESVQLEYVFGYTARTNNYHTPLIRTELTRNLGAVFPDMRDEIGATFTDVVPLSNGWTKTPALATIMQVTTRTSNRIFVGLPLCRDPSYREINTKFAQYVMIASFVIRLCPGFLRPLVGPLLSPLDSTVNRLAWFLKPIIDDRIRMSKKLGPKYEGKPNDMLSWLLDAGHETEASDLARRIIAVNFASIHTTSMSFTHALYRLAAHPQYVAVLREEIERVVDEKGWTKDAMQKMMRVDSFLKECQRFYGVTTTTLSHQAMKDYTFSDGTFIPKGTFVSTASRSIHFDDEYYENAHTFNPWRFYEMRTKDSQAAGDGVKYQFATASKEFLGFGSGRHTCPGRFFAALQMKTILAHVVMNYDVKLEHEGQIPPFRWIGSTLLPDMGAHVMFRRRQT